MVIKLLISSKKNSESSWGRGGDGGNDILPVAIRTAVDVSLKIVEDRRKWCSIFQVLEKKELSTQNLIPCKNILWEQRRNKCILR